MMNKQNTETRNRLTQMYSIDFCKTIHGHIKKKGGGPSRWQRSKK